MIYLNKFLKLIEKFQFKNKSKIIHSSDKTPVPHIDNEQNTVTEKKTKSLFIHIPKVAVSSIEKALYGTKGKVGHSSVMELLSKDPTCLDNVYSFAFCRHPFDRFVSAYEYLKQGGLNQYDKAWAEENILPYNSFKSFVMSLNDETQKQKILNWMHFKPQYLFVCNEKNNIVVDFIGTYENLENDFNTLAKQLSLNTSLPHENRTDQRKDYRQYYDDETLQIVYRTYKVDFELFNYTV